MFSKTKQTTLTNKQKLEVLNYKDKNPDISNVDIAKWVKETFSLNIHLSTVGRILKQNNNTFEEMPTMKRSRAVTYPELDDALHEWVLQNQAYLILSDAILTEKAKAFANLLNIPEGQLKFSSGWLSRFKKRHGIAKIKLYGEDASADVDAAAAAIPKLNRLLAQYHLQNIYNMDETALFYR
ncbi:11958_t:CDS:1, partial [Racocetra persica]